MTMSILRFNFASPQEVPAERRDRIQAAMELSSWSETRGVNAVSFDEHHATGHGWSCNPILMAAAFLGRTTKVIVSVDCTLGPLWHPVRLAEDIALVDTISSGRGAMAAAMSTSGNLPISSAEIASTKPPASLLISRLRCSEPRMPVTVTLPT